MSETAEAKTEASPNPDVTADATTPELGAEESQQQDTKPEEKATEPSPEPADGKAEDAPKGAPEVYEFQAPEGQEFDEEVLAAYSEAARELNLDNESAQKMLNAVAPVLAQRGVERVEALRNELVEKAKADKEIGGDAFDQNLAVARKTLERFGTPELTQLLNESGLGNHPEVIRWAHRVGKAISEDETLVTGSASPPEVDPAERVYPTMRQK